MFLQDRVGSPLGAKSCLGSSDSIESAVRSRTLEQSAARLQSEDQITLIHCLLCCVELPFLCILHATRAYPAGTLSEPRPWLKFIINADRHSSRNDSVEIDKPASMRWRQITEQLQARHAPVCGGRPPGLCVLWGGRPGVGTRRSALSSPLNIHMLALVRATVFHGGAVRCGLAQPARSEETQLRRRTSARLLHGFSSRSDLGQPQICRPTQVLTSGISFDSRSPSPSALTPDMLQDCLCRCRCGCFGEDHSRVCRGSALPCLDRALIGEVRIALSPSPLFLRTLVEHMALPLWLVVVHHHLVVLIFSMGRTVRMSAVALIVSIRGKARAKGPAHLSWPALPWQLSSFC